jgi:hypothetical protein
MNQVVRSTKKPYGPAQESFIKRTRESIKVDNRFFEKHDWTRICYKNVGRGTTLKREGKDAIIPVEAFYIKDLTVWIPEMIIPDHTPTCPSCSRSKSVMSTNSWVAKPKILYSL